jgi:hypothetical protein
MSELGKKFAREIVLRLGEKNSFVLWESSWLNFENIYFRKKHDRETVVCGFLARFLMKRWKSTKTARMGSQFKKISESKKNFENFWKFSFLIYFIRDVSKCNKMKHSKERSKIV